MSGSTTVGLILAGGRSRRFEGTDKAFIRLAGRSLWQHAAAHLAPQVDILAISSNAPAGLFAADCENPAPLTVLPDVITGFQGPLAGIHAGLIAWPDYRVVSVAVDLPFLPPDLVARLADGLRHGRCAYATDGERHALAVLWVPGAAEDVATYLKNGVRSVRDYLVKCGDPVLFKAPGDGGLFVNINNPQDLAAAELRLQNGSHS